ncbi:MAG: PfkB family carbohydrate kinase, partial [Planctomycetota bacterium]
MTTLPPLDSLGSPRILVIGDLMLDEYIWGAVSRISPEAPVPVLSGHHREYRAGGAGSVVELLSVLGARVEVCGWIGTDSAGRKLAEILRGKALSDKGLIQVPDRPTTLKTRMLASVQQAHRAQQQVLRVDWEEV